MYAQNIYAVATRGEKFLISHDVRLQETAFSAPLKSINNNVIQLFHSFYYLRNILEGMSGFSENSFKNFRGVYTSKASTIKQLGFLVSPSSPYRGPRPEIS